MKKILMAFVLFGSISISIAEALPNKITMASIDQDWFPIYYRDSNGRYLGVWPDLLDGIFKETLGVELQKTHQPWLRAQSDVKFGDADIFITIPTEDRLEFSTPVPSSFFSITFQLLIPKNHPRFQELEQIQTLEEIKTAGITLVSTLGNGWYKENVEALGIPTEYVKTDEQQVKFLLAGRADALIDFPITLDPVLTKFNANEQLLFTDAIFSETTFHILVSKKSPWINHLDALESALNQIKQTKH
jgi:polar amino acid transport system substrate-binding protein